MLFSGSHELKPRRDGLAPRKLHNYALVFGFGFGFAYFLFIRHLVQGYGVYHVLASAEHRSCGKRAPLVAAMQRIGLRIVELSLMQRRKAEMIDEAEHALSSH